MSTAGIPWHRCLGTAAVLGGMLTGASSAQASPATSEATAGKASSCSFGAFVRETDRAGLNVRQAPGVKARIVGVLPPVYISAELNGYPVKVEVDVLGGQAGWFKIEGAKDNTSLTGRPARRLYSGVGWVSGRKLTVKSQATRAHASPNKSASVLLQLRDGSSFDLDSFIEASHLIDCRGNWALLEVSAAELSEAVRPLLVAAPAAGSGLPAGHYRAWFSQLCGIQETSCSGFPEKDANNSTDGR